MIDVGISTKLGGFVTAAVGAPSAIWGMASGEWSAVAVGVAVGMVAGCFTLASFVNDRRIKLLIDELDSLRREYDGLRSRWKEAQESSDTWEIRAHRLQVDDAARCPWAKDGKARCDRDEPPGEWIKRDGAT